MLLHDRISPFLVVSLLLHVAASFWYAKVFEGKPPPIAQKHRYHQVNLVEIPKPPPQPEPEVVRASKKEPVKRVPEKILPKKERKKKEPPREMKEPREEPKREKAPPVQKEVTEEPSSLPAKGPVTVEVENFAFSYYLAVIESRVGGRWAPPKGLVSGGQPPSVTVRFEILRDGTITSPQVTQSSGLPFFDLSAMRAVEGSNPLPPLPQGFEGHRLGVNFVFHYEG